MPFPYKYHLSPEVLHIGTEAPRAYFIPGSDETEAVSENRALSSRFRSLNGDWFFRYYRSSADIEDFTSPDFTVEGSASMAVPRSWQTVPGYDTPNYTNVRYPFPADPPFVPDGPSALYIREFYMEEPFLKDRSVFLNFEGVDSCFYLYVNDCFVGYSQVSHCTSEFNVTEWLHKGSNTVKVLVFKWCDGSYLEDQDKFRFSGIFRDVYLLSRDTVRIRDIYLKQELTGDFRRAVLTAEIAVEGAAEVSYRLLNPQGTEENSGSILITGQGSFECLVEHPALWSDETPALYTLLLRCGDEYIALHPGFRSFIIRNKTIFINGKKVKARGVNRHDSNPYLGSATPMDHMLEDLYILKRHNVNMIRTSHYPNDPRFPGLCDRLGFYLCDETDYETHGAQQLGNWDYFSTGSEWTASLLDRVERLFERDKNHACVIFWSLGNESGVGENQHLMSDYIRRRCPGAIIHCEDVSRRMHTGSTRPQCPSIEGKDECPWVDVESRMYPSVDEALAYIQDKRYTKPYYLCEYCHAMGNGPGDFRAYWDAIRAHDEFFGGCVWEFTDHSVAEGTDKYADPHYIYGGDYGDWPHDGNFCVDGLVYPDRRPHTGLLEYKQVIAPFEITDVAEDGSSFRVKNRLFFRDLSDCSLSWKIESNGRVLRTGFIPSLAVAPGRSRRYAADVQGLHLTGSCYITFSVRQNTATEWADAGYEIGFSQAKLASETVSLCRRDGLGWKTPVELRTFPNEFTVVFTSGSCTVSRTTGLITSLVHNGKEMLASPIAPTVWRAPTDNDRRIKNDWYNNHLDRLHTYLHSLEVLSSANTEIRLDVRMTLAANATVPALRLHTVYTFLSDGSIELATDAEVHETMPVLPRFGWQFRMPEDTEQLRYFGRGPVESYTDKRWASRQGLFTCRVTDHFEHYVRPQENMAHTDTEWVSISDLCGHGLLCTGAGSSFSFNCSHFTPEDLTVTAHDYELKPRRETVVNIDYKQAGIGSNSCGPALAEELRFREKAFSFTARIIPCNINETDAFAEAAKN